MISFNSVGFALGTSEDSIFVDEITINPRHGIVKGESAQLTATLSPDDVSSRMVEWSSSDESVISCTKEGLIKGVSDNGYADITCKARFGDAKDTIRIYCAESIGGYYRDDLKDWFVQIYDQPEVGISSTLYFNYNKLIKTFMAFWIDLLSKFPIPLLSGLGVNEVSAGPCEVRGRYGKFAYVVVYTKSGGADGFVKFTKLQKGSSYFLSLSAEDIDVWANGYSYPHRKLTTQYKGTVKWDVADNTIVKFNEQTGQITAYKPGRTTITATAGGMKRICTIHALYRWPQQWTAKTNQDTSLYKAKGSGYVAGMALAAGKKFVVWGDDGSSEGWAYGNIEGTDYWGYVPISHISTKGTISQYNLMNFRWPVNDLNIKKISSPFGPRSSDNGGNHKGFDIVANTSGAIEGKAVVLSYSGTIKKIYIDNDKRTSHGNSIVITTDKIDPISGKNLTVIYMHLSRWENNISGIVVNGKVLKEGDYVNIGQIIGYAGNTGYNTTAAHLHFEVNNQNAAIRKGSDNPFTETINPIYFYMDMDESITKSDTCEAAYNGNGFYWYGENA